ncbi:MAG: response regulator, partial [Chloroflexaceae bacterium]|nr:response regulator [Chloroflexaceae bacterium]
MSYPQRQTETDNRFDQHFYAILEMLSLYPDTNAVTQQQFLQQIDAYQQQWQSLATAVLHSYEQRSLLVAAEHARVLHHTGDAREYYDQAITLARQNQHGQDEGLACELAALFYLARKQTAHARIYLEQAHDAYHRCGLLERARALQTTYLADTAHQSTSAAWSYMMLQSSYHCEYWITPDGHYRYISPSCERITGYQPEAFYTNPDLLFTLVHPNDDTIVLGATEHGNEPEIAEFRILNHNGEERWLHQVSQSVYHHGYDGNWLGNRVSLIDVTERKLVEQALCQSHSFLAGLLDHLPAAVYMRNRDGRYVMFNQHASHLVEPVYNQELNRTDVEQIIKQERTVEQEIVFEHADGPHTYTVLQFPLYDTLGSVYAIGAVGIDITEQKHTINALSYARQVAESATRAKSAFLANMSHEMRTPMNAVIGMTALLLHTNLDAEQEEYIQTIRISGDALLNVINDILDFSKIEAGKLDLECQPFHLRQCIEETLDLLAATAAEKELELLYVIDEQTPCYLVGDTARLRQILVNLVSNAIKFTHIGEVMISIELENAARNIDPTHPRSVTYQTIHIRVRDTGIGISAEQREHLFQPFSQGDSSSTRRYGGTGLGLAISKRLAEMMGGTLWFESAVNQGSTFHVTLPFRTENGVSEVFRGNEHPQLQGKRVLVIEPNATSRVLLQRYLQSWGMFVHLCGSTDEAQTMLSPSVRHPAMPPLDVIIADGTRPDAEYTLLMQQIHQIAATQPLHVIFWTSFTAQKQLRQQEVGNIAVWLTKPIKPGMLYDTLTMLFHARKPVHRPLRNWEHITYNLAQYHPLRILLVEDNLINQKVALRLLEKMGYHADIASNGLEALHILEHHIYDVVLMDVQMPEMDGTEATQRIRTTWPPEQQPHIIAMTAHAMQGSREWLLGLGMDDYVEKPVRTEELIRALSHVGRLPSQTGLNRDGASTIATEAEPINKTILKHFLEMVGHAESNDDLLSHFLADAAEQTRLMQQALDQGDMHQLMRNAHQLKSNSTQVGAIELSAICQKLEHIGHPSLRRYIPELVKQLQDEYERVAVV